MRGEGKKMMILVGCYLTLGLFAVVDFFAICFEKIYDKSPKLREKIKKIYDFVSRDFL